MEGNGERLNLDCVRHWLATDVSALEGANAELINDWLIDYISIKPLFGIQFIILGARSIKTFVTTANIQTQRVCRTCMSRCWAFINIYNFVLRFRSAWFNNLSMICRFYQDYIRPDMCTRTSLRYSRMCASRWRGRSRIRWCLKLILDWLID